MKINVRPSLIRIYVLGGAMLALPAAVQAQFTYTNINGTITITGYTGLGGAVTIPDTINGGSVTGIGYQAFWEKEKLTSVTIPDSVTSIGDGAFASATSLTNVTIGNGVTSIGYGVFYDCPSLTNITVDPLNSVYSSLDGALFDKSQVTLIQFPGGRVGTYSIPDSVTEIGSEAFYNCVLTSITIGSGVIGIGYGAFIDCNSLTGVYFKGNVPDIGVDIFTFVHNATVYYLPGTTGWGSTLAGRPTALWLPQMQTDDATFGVRKNQFGFNINWASGQTVMVEACTNLTNPMWSPVSTNLLTSDTMYFSDSQWTNYSARFYRLHSP